MQTLICQYIFWNNKYACLETKFVNTLIINDKNSVCRKMSLYLSLKYIYILKYIDFSALLEIKYKI